MLSNLAPCQKTDLIERHVHTASTILFMELLQKGVARDFAPDLMWLSISPGNLSEHDVRALLHNEVLSCRTSDTVHNIQSPSNTDEGLIAA